MSKVPHSIKRQVRSKVIQLRTLRRRPSAQINELTGQGSYEETQATGSDNWSQKEEKINHEIRIKIPDSAFSGEIAKFSFLKLIHFKRKILIY